MFPTPNFADTLFIIRPSDVRFQIYRKGTIKWHNNQIRPSIVLTLAEAEVTAADQRYLDHNNNYSHQNHDKPAKSSEPEICNCENRHVFRKTQRNKDQSRSLHEKGFFILPSFSCSIFVSFILRQKLVRFNAFH